MGFFSKIKNGLKKTKDALITKLNAVFRGGDIDTEFYEDLEFALVSSDMGVETSEDIIAKLRDRLREKHIVKQERAREELKDVLVAELESSNKDEFEYPMIITIVGVNGVGKTTTIGKLAHFFKTKKKSVSLVAGDTFRAAATEQLSEWGKRADVKIIKHAEGADPGGTGQAGGHLQDPHVPCGERRGLHVHGVHAAPVRAAEHHPQPPAAGGPPDPAGPGDPPGGHGRPHCRRDRLCGQDHRPAQGHEDQPQGAPEGGVTARRIVSGTGRQAALHVRGSLRRRWERIVNGDDTLILFVPAPPGTR